MSNKNYINKKILLLCTLIALNAKVSFALENSLENEVFKDLELFMQIYEMDEGEGILFEKVEDSKNYNSTKVSLETKVVDDDLQKLALSYIGKKYKYGASGPDEFDCSGLVLDYFKNLNKMVPRTSALQSEFGILVEKENLRIGDVVFFDTRSSTNADDIKINVADTISFDTDIHNDTFKGKVTHSGIYIGDGKFVHASSGSIMRVVVEDLNSKYFSQRYLFARRYL